MNACRKTPVHRAIRSLFGVGCFIVLVSFLCPTSLKAQELEPRSLSNVPVGSNFFAFGWGHSWGNILLDSALPVENLDAQLHVLSAGYVRAIDVFGLSGKIDVLIPFAAGDYHALVEGQEESLSLNGLGDPRVRLSVNFFGAPALHTDEYKNYHQKTIVGASLQVILPLGQYDSSEIINLGSNRFTFRTQIGVSHVVNKWFLEAHTGFWFFSKNPDYYGGNEFTQKPLYIIKLHAIRSLPRGMWIAGGVAYGVGGQVYVNGVFRNIRISNIRLGATFALPLAEHHTIKATFRSGIRFERGGDFDSVALIYQYFWGGL